MRITNKSKKWEFFNSLWIIWSFTLLFACVGFFIIGGRTGQRKWIVSGLIYLFTNLGVVLVASQFMYTEHTIYYHIGAVIAYIGWFTAIVHSFLSRKEYLIRFEAVTELKVATREAYRNELRKQYLGEERTQPVNQFNQQTQTQAPTFPQPSQPSQPSPQPPVKINLNTATLQQLSDLPGVGIVHAKKAIEMREQSRYAFISVSDFCEKLELMPHFAAQIENLAFVNVEHIQPPPPPPENIGRVIDI